MADHVSDDLYIGRQILEHSLVGRDELVDCVIEAARERKGGQYGRPLGVVLVDRGLISEGQLAGLLARRVDPSGGDTVQMSDIALGKLFVASGYTTSPQVDECLAEQRRQRDAGEPVRRLGELLVERGFSTAQQVMRVLAYQSKRIYQCPSCLARYNVASPKPGTVYRCKKCQQELRPAGRAADGAGPTEEIARATDRAENEQAELDRALSLYLRQKQLVRRDALRDAEQVQLDIRRYGLVVPLLQILRRINAVSWQQQKELDAVDFAAVIRKPGWGDQAVPGYKLLSKLASGGYATLYSAEPVFGGPKIAVKLLHPDRAGQERSVKRFKHESALLKKFEHPNIVRGIDSGEHAGTHYLVMEYVEGRSVGQRIAESGALGVRESVAIVRQAAAALSYLHKEGYLHRDVKPDNLLLDASGKAWLADLGFAAPVGSATATVGTAGYASPEQAAGAGEVKVGTDIYSLGITLYAMLTGIEPFGASNSEETVAAQVEEGMPTPNLMILQAPPGVVQVLRKMMHHDRARRYQSMVDVAAALDGIK